MFDDMRNLSKRGERSIEQKGAMAEERFERIARMIPIVRKVRHASDGLDRVGIDFLLLGKVGSRVRKIPVQVKSSKLGLDSYYRLYPQYKEYGVIGIVVNWYRSDEEIRIELETKLRAVFFTEKDYTRLLAQIRVNAERRKRTPDEKSEREYKQKKNAIRQEEVEAELKDYLRCR